MATSTVLNENYITNYARLGHAAQELLPEVLRELVLIKEPTAMLYKDCQAKAAHILRPVEWRRITNVATDGYSKFDIQLLYKIIRNLNLVPCPTRGWDHPQDPMVHELTIGDDVERIRRQRNEILHKGETKVTDTDLAEYFAVFKGLASRLEIFLSKPQGHFLSKFEQLETQCMDQKSEEQFIQTIKDLVKNEEDIKDEVGRVRIEVEQLKIKGNTISKLEEENKYFAERIAKLEEMLLSSLKQSKVCEADVISKDTMDLFETYLVEWQEDENNFVLTRAAQYVLDAIVADNIKCIAVTGCPGSGKSAIIHHAAIFLQKTMAYEIIPVVNEPGDFKQYFSSSRQQVFVLDNTFGTIAVNAPLVESWYANLEVIEKMVNMGNTKVLLSCRMHIMKDSHLQRLKLFTSNECNLHTEKNCLLKKERIMIAERYLNSSEVKEISDIMNLYEFFPLLCKWYAKNKKPSIGDFFQNPVDIFKQNIVEMKEDPNRIQYCAFVLCLLHNGILHEQWFEIGSVHESTLQSICEEFGIDFRIKRKILQEQLDRLESTFIKKVNRNYYIVHDKVYDVAVAICGQDLVECFIEYTDSIFIGDRYQLESIDTCLDETIIRIPKTHEDRYFQRLLKDLECGHIYSSFQNRQLQNQKFRDKLIAFMRRNKCIVRNILKKFDELQLRLIESRQQTEDFISLSAEESDHLSSDEGSDHSSSDEGSDHSSFGEDRDHSSFDEDTESDNMEAQRPRRNKQNTNQICPSDDQDFPLPLLESSVQGHEDVVQMLINFGCNVNVFDKFRRTALFLAASHGHRSTVEILLQSNCNSSLCDVWERSPFYVACQEGHSEIVKLLLKVSDISKSDTCYFKTPLHVASESGHFMIVKMLLENGSSIYQCNTDGHSPLFVACERGHTQLVQLLLAYSSDINQRDEKDKTPLFIACENGYSEVVKILLDHEANISLCNSDGLSPIHVACKWGHTNTVTILMERNADINRLDRLYGRTPLFLAVEGHYSEIIELLVKNGCDIFTCDKRKQSPLYVACKTGQTSIVKLLLEHMDEYYVLSFNYSEWSPLIAACEGGYDSIVQMLLERNFYINIRDRNVKCPIHIACENGFTDIMTTLLSHDCEVDCLDGDSRSALLIACENGYSDIAKLLLENKANLLLTDEDNWSPFQVACYEGHADIVELLIQYNAETMQCDDKNRSPLFIACMKGHSSVVELLLSTNRADVNQSDVRKWTPLHIASKEGHRDVVKVLLKYGAEKNLPNDTGRSPLDLARSSFRTAIVQLLDVDTSSND